MNQVFKELIDTFSKIKDGFESDVQKAQAKKDKYNALMIYAQEAINAGKSAEEFKNA